MTAAKLDLLIEQGATFRRTLSWKDEEGAAINLTGYSARMQMREHLSSAAPFLEITTINGGITITPEIGKLELLISAEDTDNITAPSAVYDLELESSSGDVTRLLQGNVIIERSVTR